jgi:hypothetical protein
LKLEDFLECLKSLIACTGCRRIAYLLSKVYTKGTIDIVIWCLKLWLILISRFGTHFWYGEFTQWYQRAAVVSDVLLDLL